jgi:hypothetical protein
MLEVDDIGPDHFGAAVSRSSGRVNFEFHFDIDLNRDGLAL